MDPLWQQINDAVHRRELKTIHNLIPKYLKAHRSSHESIYEASEFLRKITDYTSALRVLPKERAASSAAKISEIETKLELQLARILNILGASNYALRMIDRIRSEKRAKSKIEMVEIYHCNCKFNEVIELIGADFPLPDSEPWHQDWLLHFYFAHAQNRVGHRSLAITRMDRIRTLSKSPLIHAIALSYKGQFLVEDDTPKLALPVLLEAQRFFQKDDQTSDHAILQKWLGICYLKLKKFEEAKKALKISFDILYQPALKAEDWMEMVLWMEKIPGYREPRKHLAPRLWAMSGPDYLPLKEAGIESCGDETDIFSISKLESTRELRHIDRGSDTYWDDENPRLGLDLVDLLIWTLIYAGEYGLPQFRLYELLWPHEPFSFDQHQKRLERLVGRARKQGFEIVWKDLHLRLASKDLTASGLPLHVIRGRSFLLQHAKFTRNDVEKYFSMSRTAAIVLCREWLEAGLTESTERSQYKSLIRTKNVGR